MRSTYGRAIRNPSISNRDPYCFAQCGGTSVNPPFPVDPCILSPRPTSIPKPACSACHNIYTTSSFGILNAATGKTITITNAVGSGTNGNQTLASLMYRECQVSPRPSHPMIDCTVLYSSPYEEDVLWGWWCGQYDDQIYLDRYKYHEASRRLLA